MVHTRLPRCHHWHLNICPTATPKRRRNRWQVSERTWQLASLRRLLQIASQPDASYGGPKIRKSLRPILQTGRVAGHGSRPQHMAGKRFATDVYVKQVATSCVQVFKCQWWLCGSVVCNICYAYACIRPNKKIYSHQNVYCINFTFLLYMSPQSKCYHPVYIIYMSYVMSPPPDISTLSTHAAA